MKTRTFQKIPRKHWSELKQYCEQFTYKELETAEEFGKE